MRPITLLAILAMFALAVRPAPPEIHPPEESAFPQHASQQQQETVQTQTELALSKARADALEQTQSLQDQQLKQALRKLAALEAVLDMRKVAGVHLIDGQLLRDSHGNWHVDLTMVRGGNHRALLHTWLRFFANSQYDQPLTVRLQPEGENEPMIACDLETHAFIHAQIAWPPQLPLHSVMVTVIDADNQPLANIIINNPHRDLKHRS
ncbi:MAG: hypothetical protein R8J84_01880 [Mariprofundales bacterium]